MALYLRENVLKKKMTGKCKKKYIYFLKKVTLVTNKNHNIAWLVCFTDPSDDKYKKVAFP